ncbi:MFS transporter [Janthinobacterium agaricidamnosum]|uniref:Sugar (And other) transporter family protein n=1 Tax=Janthinobacterium agaricidamnosum NBRC 102515 = DSM 9628 TaxID=1349767 RepID=W0UWS2_9BURK|nr:MFS transporter [Janthinobacterium agaricidamnosum]CDG80894.1 sugar (and other) transporter family protein [Janthinobacterium agaricidamnosum NBRC 102515 = DSM 9628]
MSIKNTITIDQIISGSKLSGYQILVLILCFIVVAIDGFDTAAVGYIAPALKQDWGLVPAQLGPIFGAGLFGLMLGAFLMGPVADRIGRKSAMLISVAAFGVFSLASAASTSAQMLTLMRFLVGIGLGGAMPSCIALTSEYSPQRQRVLLVTLSFCGFTLGFALGGELSAQIITHYSWRGVLLLGGVAPLLMLPALWLWLPESVRYLAAKPSRHGALHKIVRRIAGDGRWDEHHIVAGDLPGKTASPISQLFIDGQAKSTLLVWLAYFCSLFVFYLLSSWLPTIMRDAGYTIPAAARIASMVPLGGTIGAVVLARLMDKLNPCLVLAASYLLSGVAIAALGHVIGQPGWLAVAAFLVGFGMVGAQTGMNAFVAGIYPTTARATGISWALAMGRVGSIVGSVTGGALLLALTDSVSLFQAIAIPTAIAAVSLYAVNARYTKPSAETAASTH